MGLAQTLRSLHINQQGAKVDSFGISTHLFMAQAANDSGRPLQSIVAMRQGSNLNGSPGGKSNLCSRLPAKRHSVTSASGLRIVRREPVQQPARLVISGRMADVCAALEELANREAGNSATC